MQSGKTAESSFASFEEHIKQGEHRVAQLEEDFQPAGSIGPEIELVFGNAENPFKEIFEQEEVVIDRYAALESSLFAQRPVVSSHEGEELSKLLAPWTRKPPEPTLPLKAPSGDSTTKSSEAVEKRSTSSFVDSSQEASSSPAKVAPAREISQAQMSPPRSQPSKKMMRI